MAIPAKVEARLCNGLKRFQPVLAAAKARDINESDTVVVVMDMLQDVFGYDKYTEITSEHAIRGTFCDLAVKLDGALSLLIEVKAVGLELKDSFIKQAVDYAANQGVDWVVLTNGWKWRVYKVGFAKPITHDLVVEFSLTDMSHKNDADLEMLFLVAKEGWQKANISDYHLQRQALSRFSLGALLVSDPILEVLRRELRRMSPGVRIDTDQIREVLSQDVIKREILEGEKADEARRLLNRSAARALRAKSKAEGEPADAAQAPAPLGPGTSEADGETAISE
jgi:hypothetical protein